VQMYNKIVSEGKIPESLIILVVTAVCVLCIRPLLIIVHPSQIENALMEWSTDEQISLQFSDDVASSRYDDFI
jgi:hypothetical protein